ncbi:MAG: hypothetical protein ACREF3_03525, partial [Acetobacteraceae bacterium]
MLFYQRFSPHRQKYKNWRGFVEVDGVPCFEAMCENIELWETPEFREQLSKIADKLDKAFPLGDYCHMTYDHHEKEMRASRPAWFEKQRSEAGMTDREQAELWR